MLCLMGLSALRRLELLQTFKAAALQGSRNQAPHAAPGYEATSQQIILHMLLQLQTLFRERGGGFISSGGVGVLSAGKKTSGVAPLPLSQTTL